MSSAEFNTGPDAAPRDGSGEGPAAGPLDPETVAWLLAEARRTLVAELRGEADEPAPAPAAVEQSRGLFVTLRRGGELRGCIGHSEARAPLREAIRELALAASRDRRFEPVTAAELDALRIELSILTPLEEIDGPGDVEIGRDGLLIRGQGRAGLLLPQVATSRGWSPVEFLAWTCHKAGLDAEAWRLPATRLYRFQCQIVEEPTR